MSIGPEGRTARARLAAFTRHDRPQQAAAARRQLKLDQRARLAERLAELDAELRAEAEDGAA